MKTLLTSIFVVMVALFIAAPASATIAVDATFDVGALPSDFGMPGTSFGTGPHPSTTVAGGLWTQNILAGAYSLWGNYGAGGVVPGNIAGPIVHGYAELRVVAFTTTNDEQTVIFFGRNTDQVGAGNEYGFGMYYHSGQMSLVGPGVGTGGGTPVVVPNLDGGFHKYGWQVDQASRTLKVFFDDLQVGAPAGYSMTGNGGYGNVLYFGDASGGGAHHSVWDRYVVAEGAYPAVPEPSSIVLLGLGVVGLLCYAWRKRK